MVTANKSTTTSPMLRHAFESFEHGLLHYLEGTELGRKFALLHIDHAIELILKEKVVRTGQSIYRKDGKTITVHEAYAALANIPIPEKPRLEDLHDFRNIVQHKGLTPDEHTTDFYVTEAYAFMKRFLADEFAIVIQDILPQAHLRAMEGTVTTGGVLEDVKRRLLDAEQLYASGAHEMAVVSAFIALEIAVRRGLKEESPSPLSNLLRTLVDSGTLDEASWKMYKEAAALRNKAAHTGGGISKPQARQAIDELNRLVVHLAKHLELTQRST